jgi:hypothetical protein
LTGSAEREHLAVVTVASIGVGPAVDHQLPTDDRNGRAGPAQRAGMRRLAGEDDCKGMPARQLAAEVLLQRHLTAVIDTGKRLQRPFTHMRVRKQHFGACFLGRVAQLGDVGRKARP